MPPPLEITQLLLAWNQGDREVLDKLMPLVRDELYRLAESYMRRERSDHTLQPTALIHEAFMRLVDQQHINWQGRAHFFGVAANLMRQILVDYARNHKAIKRGGLLNRITLDAAAALPEQKDLDLLALDDALISLEKVSPIKSRIVEMRFFGGLSNEEIAEALNLSIPTIVRHWRVAKAWLYQQIRKGDSHDA